MLALCCICCQWCNHPIFETVDLQQHESLSKFSNLCKKWYNILTGIEWRRLSTKPMVLYHCSQSRTWLPSTLSAALSSLSIKPVIRFFVWQTSFCNKKNKTWYLACVKICLVWLSHSEKVENHWSKLYFTTNAKINLDPTLDQATQASPYTICTDCRTSVTHIRWNKPNTSQRRRGARGLLSHLLNAHYLNT